MSAPPPASRSRPRTLANLVLALVGGVLLLLTIRRVGWEDVHASIRSVGWWFAVVVALGGLRFAARACAWNVCIEGLSGQPTDGVASRAPGAVPHVAPVVPLASLFKAILAGDALGNLTPLGLLASEPAKVLLLKSHVPTVTAVSSVAAENAFYIGSALLMIGAGALVFFDLTDLSPALRTAAQVVLGLVMLSGLSAFWIARRRPAILSRLARIVAKWTGRTTVTPDRLRDLETRFYAVLEWPASRLAQVAMWEGLFHVFAVAEVFLTLRLLPATRETTLLDAFVLETAGRLIVVLFKFVPYRLGVDEAGAALVARALALDPASGVALALIRRLRILFWNAVGLGMIVRSR